jgi:hypothetical protein
MPGLMEYGAPTCPEALKTSHGGHRDTENAKQNISMLPEPLTFLFFEFRKDFHAATFPSVSSERSCG